MKIVFEFVKMALMILFVYWCLLCLSGKAYSEQSGYWAKDGGIWVGSAVEWASKPVAKGGKFVIYLPRDAVDGVIVMVKCVTGDSETGCYKDGAGWISDAGVNTVSFSAGAVVDSAEWTQDAVIDSAMWSGGAVINSAVWSAGAAETYTDILYDATLSETYEMLFYGSGDLADAGFVASFKWAVQATASALDPIYDAGGATIDWIKGIF